MAITRAGASRTGEVALSTVTSACLLRGYSLEATARDTESVREAAPFLAAGTRIAVAHLSREDHAMRFAAAGTVHDLGFRPVPHLAVRRFATRDEFEGVLGRLTREGCSESVMLLAGDPSVPSGPFRDALQVIRSGILQRHGVGEVGIAGYPEGHPAIHSSELWSALEAKVEALRDCGLGGTIVTQFCFDAQTVLSWIGEVRDRGIGLPIRIGIPGPTGARRLLAYAARLGVSSTARIARKYGLSLGNLLAAVGPEEFLESFVADYRPLEHGEVGFHFYTFGGLPETAQWIAGRASGGGGLRSPD